VRRELFDLSRIVIDPSKVLKAPPDLNSWRRKKRNRLAGD